MKTTVKFSVHVGKDNWGLYRFVTLWTTRKQDSTCFEDMPQRKMPQVCLGVRFRNYMEKDILNLISCV